MIEVDGVTKRYGSTRVLDNVSLTIPAGGVTTIIGANGAGKSTLLGVISRLIPADEGRVLVDGMDVATTPSGTLARRLAILRQDNHLAVRLTVRELVMFGRYPHSKGRPGPEDHRKVDEALAYLGLEDLADRHLDTLSGGQRQRAFVAMVLSQDTDYVLLDEPLNNLDLRHAVEMMRLLKRIARDLDRTIVLVVHDVNFASCHSDRIVALRHGRLIANGPPDTIVQPAPLAEVFNMPIPVHNIDGDLIAVPFR